MFGLAAAVALSVGAVEVVVEVAAGTPCVNEAPLKRRLSEVGLKVVEKATEATLHVTLSEEEAQLSVRGRRGAIRFERRVPAGAKDCPAVERVTLALITAWAAASVEVPAHEQVKGRWAGWSPGSEVRGNTSPAPFAATAIDRRGSSPAPNEVDRRASPASVSRIDARRSPPPAIDVDDASPVTRSSSEVDGRGITAPLPPSQVDLTVSPAPGESGRDIGTSALAGEVEANGSPAGMTRDGVEELTGAMASLDPAREERSISLEVAVLGGFSAGPTASPTAAGSLAAGLSRGRWGLLLEFGLESEHAKRSGAIRASASMQWLGISFRVAFLLLDALRLDLAVGARGWRVAASATGVDVATDQVSFAAGPSLSAGLSLRLLGGLFLHLRPSVGARVQQLVFNVEPVGRVLLIDRFSVGATLGALFRFE